VTSRRRDAAACYVGRVEAVPAPRVLVLAGRRSDAAETVGGAQPKALVEIDGVPMLERVLACLDAALGPGPVHVSAAGAGLCGATPGLARRRDAGLLLHHASARSPAASVHDFLARDGAAGATLVTTADHPLLEPEMIRHFLVSAEASGADLAAAVVEASLVRAAFPQTRRTFVSLRGGAVTGANLFLFRTPRAAEVARFWVRAEEVRKRPWRLVALFGLGALVRFAAGRIDLEAAAALVSQAVGARVAPIRLPFAECAIDVDSAEDLALARRVIAARAQSARVPSATKRPDDGSKPRTSSESEKRGAPDPGALGSMR
jgi:molybdopterin-guanine dinucleotide biosynthesis protein A